MPNNTPQPQQSQVPSPQTPPHPQPPQGGDTEKMLLQFLKELEQNVADLNQRVDVLEQKEHTELGYEPRT